MKKRVIGFVCCLLIVFLVLANVPSVSALTPMTQLDPMEGTVTSSGNNPWDFKWGRSFPYGVYIRDFQWKSYQTPPFLTLYAGMINIPWVDVDGVRYYTYNMIETCRQIRNIDYGRNWEIMIWLSFTSQYTPSGQNPITINHGLEITILITEPHFFPNQMGWIHGCVELMVYHWTDYSKTYTIDVAYRVDYDILNPGNDFQGELIGWVSGMPIINYPTTETWSTATLPWGTGPAWKVYQDDTMTCAQAGIEPWSTSDTIFFLRYNNNEYDGNPGTYLNSENIQLKDILFWVISPDTNTGFGNRIVTIKCWLV